jgi:hypothetical protein
MTISAVSPSAAAPLPVQTVKKAAAAAQPVKPQAPPAVKSADNDGDNDRGGIDVKA